MKTFTQYLTESQQTYSYRVKIAGGCDKDKLKELEDRLAKFDLIKMSNPTVTPVTQDPLDFPGIKNMEVCIFEIELDYPAGQQELFQMIENTLNIPKGNVKIVTKHFADSWDNNEGTIPNEDPSMLENDYPADTKEQKEASKIYADPSLSVPDTSIEYEIAGGETPEAQTTNDLPQGKLSPMGSTKNKIPQVKSAAR